MGALICITPFFMFPAHVNIHHVKDIFGYYLLTRADVLVRNMP